MANEAALQVAKGRYETILGHFLQRIPAAQAPSSLPPQVAASPRVARDGRRAPRGDDAQVPKMESPLHSPRTDDVPKRSPPAALAPPSALAPASVLVPPSAGVPGSGPLALAPAPSALPSDSTQLAGDTSPAAGPNRLLMLASISDSMLSPLDALSAAAMTQGSA